MLHGAPCCGKILPVSYTHLDVYKRQGETQDLAIEDVPQWVDHAYPTDLLLEQYNWSGKYKDGWLNSCLLYTSRCV